MSVSGGMSPDGGEVFCSSALTGSSSLDCTEYLLARGMPTEKEGPLGSMLGAPPVALLRLRTTILVQGVLLFSVEQKGC